MSTAQAQQAPESKKLTRHEVRRRNTQRRYQRVAERFEELLALRIQGMKPDMHSVIEKVAYEMGYTPKTIEAILWRGGYSKKKVRS